MFDIDENTMVITTVDIINKKKKVVLRRRNVGISGRRGRW